MDVANPCGDAPSSVSGGCFESVSCFYGPVTAQLKPAEPALSPMNPTPPEPASEENPASRNANNDTIQANH